MARLAPDGMTGTRWQDWHPVARLAPGGKTGTRWQDWHPVARLAPGGMTGTRGTLLTWKSRQLEVLQLEVRRHLHDPPRRHVGQRPAVERRWQRLALRRVELV